MTFKKTALSVAVIMLAQTAAFAKAPLGTDKYSRQMEALQRGVIARDANGGGIFISWRNLASDTDTTYNIYRNGKKLNKTPLSVSNYVDEDGTKDDTYFVTAVSADGTESNRSEGVKPFTEYLSIPIEKPEPRENLAGDTAEYYATKAGTGDLDGDGDYEIVLVWYPDNAMDNSYPGYTSPVIIDAYEMDGTKLWRIDMGLNIRAGEHYVPVIVYDLDGDGKSEVAIRTADGTIDGTGAAIGDASKHWADERGYILTGPEYLTIFEGSTGKALTTTDFLPERGNVEDWGDTGGNRVDRFLGGIAYLDGKTPSLIMSRGYYTNREGTVGKTEITAYDYKNGKVSVKWEFKASLQDNINPDYVGQGNHSMVTADIDNDGFDEIIYGSMAIDHDGTGIYSTKRGHGDAIHVGFFRNEDRLQLVKANESVDVVKAGYGFEYRYADKDEIIFAAAGSKDNGRTVIADIDPTSEGPFICGAGGTGMWINRQGDEWEQLSASGAANAFPIWWTGDLLRELGEGYYSSSDGKTVYNGYKVVKYNYSTTKFDTLMNIKDVISARRPLLQCDIIGDWREELLLAEEDGSCMRLYTTNDPTDYNITTLMHDPKYRLDIATQPSGYSQPPWPGFYIGHNDFELPEKGSFVYNKIPDPVITDDYTISDEKDPITFSLVLTIGLSRAVINGNNTMIDSQPGVVPFIDNDITLVPLRFISEALGYTVTYDEENKGVTLVKDDTTVKLTIGSDVYTVNGKEDKFEARVRLMYDRTFVPLRALSEIIGMDVEWDNGTITITQ